MNFLESRIGFMQGRLSAMIDGNIQAFPWNSWRDEFPIAQSLGISLMEWTIDQERLHENPLMTKLGRAEILSLCSKNKIQLPSLTGDCFMQAPFWKANGKTRIELEKDFIAVANSCYEAGILIMVIPLVDNGRIDDIEQENLLIKFLNSQEYFFKNKNIKIGFESDFKPEDLSRFMKRLNPALFGVNYDIGNSAALGFNIEEEFAKYGDRIINVHVKDRTLGGKSVPLGNGNAHFEIIFSKLSQLNYKGNFILQTARASDERHGEVLSQYRDQTINWLKTYDNQFER